MQTHHQISNLTQLACKLLPTQFDTILIVELDNYSYSEFSPDCTTMVSQGDFSAWILSIAHQISKPNRASFLLQLEPSTIQKQLAQNPTGYIVYYQMKGQCENSCYRLFLNYLDDNQEYLVITRRKEPTDHFYHTKTIDQLTHDSERFHFLVSKTCENFMEVDLQTGLVLLVRSDETLQPQQTYQQQIDWIANHVISPEEREEYLQDFQLDNLLDTLRKNNDYSCSIYSIIRNGQKYYYSIVNALYKDPASHEEKYIYSYAQDVTSYQEQEERNRQLVDISQQLINLSQTEAVTGLYNRAAFEKTIEEHLLQESLRLPGTLLLIDVDNFKNFNDSYGHIVGDAVLKYLSRVMRDVFRSDDILCRWGGDEFIIFMRNVTETRNIASRIERLRSKMYHCEQEGIPIPITVSLGVAIAQQGESFRNLFLRCDKALYHIKESGRDGYFISQTADDIPK